MLLAHGGGPKQIIPYFGLRKQVQLVDARGWGMEGVGRGNGECVFNGDRVSV